jgi:excisionase family DNA binding protein
VRDVTATLGEIIVSLGHANDLPAEKIPALLTELSGFLMLLSARMQKHLDLQQQTVIGRESDCALTVQEAAARLSFTRQYLYELIRRGEIPAIKHGKYVRLRESDLTLWMERHIENPIDGVLYRPYSDHSDRSGARKNQKKPRLHAGPNGRPDRRKRKHSSAVGAGRTEHIGAHIAVHPAPGGAGTARASDQ